MELTAIKEIRWKHGSIERLSWKLEAYTERLQELYKDREMFRNTGLVNRVIGRSITRLQKRYNRVSTLMQHINDNY